MKYKSNYWLPGVVLVLFPALSAHGQVIYGRNQALFEEQGGQVARLNTGKNEHDFISVGRNQRFVTFWTPDPVSNNGVPPSSDIYSYDRVNKTTRRIVNHTSNGSNPNSVQSFTPRSAQLSPNNQLLAYGVALTLRQGLASPVTTHELNIANASNGVILANPTFGRGPVEDSFDAEFVGLSWDPGGNSFVTIGYSTFNSQLGTPIDLPAVVRYTNTGGNNWSKSVLIAPAYFNASFPPSAQTYIYPAVSPSGAKIAFFALSWPDVIGGSQPVTAGIIVANANGSNPFIRTTFNPGYYPAGLSWSASGTELYFGIAPQVNSGTGFLPLADAPNSVVRAINVNTGAIRSLPGVGSGYWPNGITGSGGGGGGGGGNANSAIVPILPLLLD